MGLISAYRSFKDKSELLRVAEKKEGKKERKKKKKRNALGISYNFMKRWGRRNRGVQKIDIIFEATRIFDNAVSRNELSIILSGY